MTETAAGAGVLSGIKVVDFGHFVAGPLTAVMLADQGAEVVHVDRPGAELAEADAFLNRGKRRVTLDLKDPADAAIAARLAASADVVIENFRPGVMDRHGLGWQQLAPVAPQLIYCSLPGFGRDDPRAAIPAWEGVVAAATANCSIRVGQEPEGWDTTRPTYSAVPLASNFAAFLAATAIVAALTFRHRTGRGQLIEVPLFHAMFELIGQAGSFVQAVLGGGRPDRRSAPAVFWELASVLGPYNVVDFGSGVMTAFAASLGIFHQTRTGAGGRVTASLAQTATYH